MRQLIHNSFFKRNTNKGVERYLSTLGFDINAPYEFIPGPTRDFVYATDEIEEEVAVVEPDLDGPLSLYVAQLLIKAGYKTVSDVHNASDDDLLDVPGISKYRLSQIRELTAPEELASRGA